MAPKRNAREPTPSVTATTQASSTAAGSVPVIPTKASIKAKDNQSPQEVALGIWQNYLDTTPQRTKLIDVFMGFLVVVGVLQFIYCVIAGNYVRTDADERRIDTDMRLQPFNAFLSGFSATVGQFVLTGTWPRNDRCGAGADWK